MAAAPRAQLSDRCVCCPCYPTVGCLLGLDQHRILGYDWDEARPQALPHLKCSWVETADSPGRHFSESDEFRAMMCDRADWLAHGS